MLMVYVSMSVIVCIDLWSHALSISYYKMLMSCIEKESVSLFCEMRKLFSIVEEVLPLQAHCPLKVFPDRKFELPKIAGGREVKYNYC